ncbi:MAG: FecR domain-containing protein, partial [Pseudohongiellaceae bacterium]
MLISARYHCHPEPGRRTVVWLLCYALAFLPAFSFAQPDATEIDAAGRVIVTSGNVIARDEAGNDRPLSRGQSVFTGDTIYTDQGAATQLRMSDGAQIALSALTEFHIVEYVYEEDEATDRSRLDLVRGGFRTITGTIADTNPDNYEASAAGFATIGIRGTHYGVLITPAGGVVTGVYDGGTTVANATGALDLGLNADYDYAIIANAGTPPVGLLAQPPGLGNLGTLNISGDEVAEEEQADAGDGDVAGDDGDDDADTTNNQAPAANAPAADSDTGAGSQADQGTTLNAGSDTTFNAPSADSSGSPDIADTFTALTATDDGSNNNSPAAPRVNPNETELAAEVTVNPGNGSGGEPTDSGNTGNDN